MGITGTRWNGHALLRAEQPRLDRSDTRAVGLRHQDPRWRQGHRSPQSPPMSSPACTCRSTHIRSGTMRRSRELTAARTGFPLWYPEDGEDRRCAIGRSAFVLQQPHLERRPRAGSRLHRRALPDVLEGKIEPGRVFDRLVGLNKVSEGYLAMDQREPMKVMINPLERKPNFRLPRPKVANPQMAEYSGKLPTGADCLPRTLKKSRRKLGGPAGLGAVVALRRTGTASSGTGCPWLPSRG